MNAPRTVIASISMTLDGRTTGPGGPYDMGCIAPHGISDEARDALVRMTTSTVALLGRVNYEGFGSYWPQVATDPNAEVRDRTFAQWLDEVEKVVFSTDAAFPLPWRNSRRSESTPVEEVRGLRAVGSGDIRVLSSQSIIRQLMAADEVDQLELTLAPEVAGGGARLFREDSPASRWVLGSSQPTSTGAVRLVYNLERA